MNKRIIFFIALLGLTYSQNQIHLTQQSHVHGGTAYLVNSTSTNPTVKYHTVTVGQKVVGSVSSSSYSMDFGIWAFYQKEPDAPIVTATDGDGTGGGIQVSYIEDPLSPPGLCQYHSGTSFVDFGDYSSMPNIQSNSIAMSRTEPQTGIIDYHYTSPLDFYNSPTIIPNITSIPGLSYIFAITTFNKYGISEEGSDLGFTLADGNVNGIVKKPSLLGDAGIKDVEVRLNRNDGETIGYSLLLDGVDDFLSVENIYQTDIADNSFSLEFWFEKSQNANREYIFDGFMSVYLENDKIHANIGEEILVSDDIVIDNKWYHVAITQGDRGACLTTAEVFTDANDDGLWNIGEVYTDSNSNSFYDFEEVKDISNANCSAYGGVWDTTYLNSGLSMYTYLDLGVEDSGIKKHQSAVGAVSSSSMLYIGKSSSSSNDNYQGRLDDFRIWSQPRTETEVTANRNRFLDGSEDFLLGYWKMNAGMFDKAYDVNPNESKNHLSINLGSTGDTTEDIHWSNNTSNQYISSFTEESGFYNISNIPYDATNWSGTQFRLVPYKLNHDSFQPTSRPLYMRLDDPIKNNINFTDNSLFQVSGNIAYEDHQSCTIQSAEIKIKYKSFSVDNDFASTVPPTYTNSLGDYSLYVEPGETFQLSATYKDHSFKNENVFYDIEGDISGVNFLDTEKRDLYTTVAVGLCETMDIGGYTLKVSQAESAFDCINLPDIALSLKDYTVEGLPPLKYNLQVIPTNPNVTFSSKHVDLDTSSETADPDQGVSEELPGQSLINPATFIFYPSIEVSVIGINEVKNETQILKELADSCGQCTNSNTYLCSDNMDHDTCTTDIEGDDGSTCGGCISSEINTASGDSCIPDSGNNQYQCFANTDCSTALTGLQNTIPSCLSDCYSNGATNDEGICTSIINNLDCIKDCDGIEYTSVDKVCSDEYIFQQGNDYTATFDVNEKYIYPAGTIQTCPLDTINFSVLDNITNLGQTAKIPFYRSSDTDYDGSDSYVYTFAARATNIMDPYLNSLQIQVSDIDNSIARDATPLNILAYVNGTQYGSMSSDGEPSLPSTTETGILTTTSTFPLFVLRDPPGDGSFSSISTKQQICQIFSMSSGTDHSNSVENNYKGGPNFEALGLDLDIIADAGDIGTATLTKQKGGDTQVCIDVTETLSTPDDAAYVGGDGDIFVGIGMSVKFSKAITQTTTVLESGACDVSQTEDVIQDITGISSSYKYNQFYIKNMLIPQLEAQGDIDGVINWQKILDLNDFAKGNARASKFELSNPDETSSSDWLNPPVDTDACDGSSGSVCDGGTASEAICIAIPIDAASGLNCEWTALNTCIEPTSNFLSFSCEDLAAWYSSMEQAISADPLGFCEAQVNCSQANNQEDCEVQGVNSAAVATGLDVYEYCAWDSDDQSCSCNLGLNGEAPIDCLGEVSGDALYDNCGVCDGDNSTCSGQTIIAFSSGVIYEYAKESEGVASSTHAVEMSNSEELYSEFGALVNDVGYSRAQIDIKSKNDDREYAADTTDVTINSFTLYDDDPGDNFLVEIKEDPIWGMPVYTLIGGQSECPWESGTMRRNAAQLQVRSISDNQVVSYGEEVSYLDINQYDAAELILRIGNNSPTGESKPYMFRLLNESNPLGALVTYNGQPMTSPFELTVAAPTHGSCTSTSTVLVESCFVLNESECTTSSDCTWDNNYSPGMEQATIYIRKDDASSEFSYDNLKFEQYPVCAESQVASTSKQSAQISNATANIRFSRPCTEVVLSSSQAIDEELIVNSSFGTLIELEFSQYSFVDPYTQNVENLKNIYLEYQYNNSGDWFPLNQSASSATLDELAMNPQDDSSEYVAKGSHSFTIMIEQSDANNSIELLQQGSYKFRAVSECDGIDNNNYSNVLNAVIDNISPSYSLMIPEPAGTLDGNNQISLIFDEALDCEWVENYGNEIFTITNLYADDDWLQANPDIEEYYPEAADPVFTVTCLDNQVSINIAPTFQKYKIENNLIRVIAETVPATSNSGAISIRDLYKNRNSQIIMWEFHYDKNPIMWSESSLSGEVFLGDDNTFSAYLNNVGVSPQTFDFIGSRDIPDGISINPESGWINAQSQMEITITATESLPLGLVEEILYAQNENGHEPLNLNFDVHCKPPVVDFNSSNYQFTTPIIAQLTILNSPLTTTYDRVVAMIDGEIRGYADIEGIAPYEDLVFINVYGNQEEQLEKDITFRLWSDQNCMEYWNIESTIDLAAIAITFNYMDIYGSILNPVVLNAVDNSTAQHIVFDEGWSWLSFNLENDEMSTPIALSYLSPASGDSFVDFNNSGYVQYSYNLDGWFGAPIVIDNSFMYQLNLESPDTLTFIGTSVENLQIEYLEGINWIGYKPQTALALNYVLPDSLGDNINFIKGRFGFSQYVAGFGWIGSLTYMYPGQGYILNAHAPGSFGFSVTSGGGLLSRENSARDEVTITKELQLSVNLKSSDFEHTMAIISEIDPSTIFLDDYKIENLVAIAYIGDEVRGISKIKSIEELEQDLIFLSVYGHDINEEMTIRIYDSASQKEFYTDLEFNFIKDDLLGDISNPIMLSNIVPVIPESYHLSQNYPNPFNPTTRIDYQLPVDSQLDIIIYNIKGQEIISLKSEIMGAGYGSVVWSGLDNSGLSVASGIYFVKMQTPSFTMTHKMMLLK